MSRRKKTLRLMLPTGRFEGLTPIRSMTMKAIKGNGNKSTETRLRFALVRAGISGWILNPKNIFGTPDFYFPQPQLAVFVDGCFWHGCRVCGHIPKANRPYWAEKIKRNRTRDRHVNATLTANGIRVIRAWEHEIAAELESLVFQVQRALCLANHDPELGRIRQKFQGIPNSENKF
jgi:DNA mismatch endonuclease (patch repair protein)